jgi:TM2 domain-containing membrane protein YozV/Tfp pilus assembly major pilin PilA
MNTAAGYNMVPCRACRREIHRTASLCPHCGATQRTRGYKSKVAAGLLAILLGGLGIHRFYLGRWWGIFYLLLFWTAVPGLIALIEGIVFLVSDQEKWDAKYNEGKGRVDGEGSTAIVVAAVAGVFVFIFIIGILAAIAIPAYHDYTSRVRVSQGLAASEAARNKVTQYIISNHALPESSADVGLDEEPPSQFLKAISVQHGGVITVEFSGATKPLAGKTIVLEPMIENNTLRWSCTGGTVEARYRPAGCREPRT